MLPGFLLSLREGLEMALITGIVLGALRKTQRTHLNRAVWAGVFSAALLSLVIAIILRYLGAALQGRAEEIFEGLTMLLAAGILTWMIFWMQRQSRSLRGKLESDVNQAARSGGWRGLFALAFISVFREGLELALFLIAAAALSESAAPTVTGAVLGMGLAILIGWGLFASTIRLDLRRFFLVTSALLVLFAAGLVAHGVHELNEAGLVPPLIEHVWDINYLLDESSFLGQILKTLFGYNANPSLSESLAYSLYFLLILLGLYLFTRSEHPRNRVFEKNPVSPDQ